MGGDSKGKSHRGKVFFEVNRHAVGSDGIVADGEWHHIAATYDGAEQRLYVDGVKQQNSRKWTGKVGRNASDLGIGNSKVVHEEPHFLAFDGVIDELKIYNRALSAKEAGELFALESASVSMRELGTAVASGAPQDTAESGHALPSTKASGSSHGWQSLFDGKTLDGWHAIGEGNWTVENGVIVGRLNNGETNLGYLVLEHPLADFMLRLQFKLTSGDSGVYFRGHEGISGQFFGLQVEIPAESNPIKFGALLNMISVNRNSRVARPPPIKFTRGDWNDLEISAFNQDIKVKINGIVAADLVDAPRVQQGQIALQVRLEGAEVLFRNIVLCPERSG
jgi:hypothetical protein